MDKTIFVSASDYSQPKIDAAVKQIFDEYGGAAAVVGLNKNVFLKINLVREMSPEKCGTTHPSIVQAVCKLLIEEANANVTVGDSSGSAYTATVMNNTYKTCGIVAACANSGASLNQNFASSSVSIGGKVVHLLELTDSFLDADVVVNIGKLKTHSFTGYTGVVKNLYGLIPGLTKAQTHSLYPDLDSFTDCLVDIERFASQKIVFHILDAVMGMEGSGPTNGHPRFIGKIFAGKNPYLVDVAGVSLFADPASMPLLAKAQQRGLLPQNLQDTGIDFKTLKNDFIDDFDKVKIVGGTDFNKTGFLKRFLRREWVTQRPVIDKSICKGCARCFNHCPRQAIAMNIIDGKNQKKAHIDSKKCIRCYCCQELCPFDAVKLKKPLLYRILRTYNGRNKFARRKGKPDKNNNN